MLDASAWELADFNDAEGSDGAGASHSHGMTDVAGPAAMAIAACGLCNKAFGACAIDGARAGALSPAVAVAVCASVQKMAERAFEARARTASGYFAYVLFGAPRSEASRLGDLSSLAETMR